MSMRGIDVRIMDATKSFISFRYINSNARSRVRRNKFVEDYKKGVFHVLNPQALGEDVTPTEETA